MMSRKIPSSLLIIAAVIFLSATFLWFYNDLQPEHPSITEKNIERNTLAASSMMTTTTSQLPDTSSKTGLFIAAYGEAARYDPAFLANNFDVIIPTSGLSLKIREKNPNPTILYYNMMNGIDTTSTWYPDWHEVNKEEEMFQHSTDPAGISFVPEDQQITIYWQSDKRNTFPKPEDNSFVLAGYNIYRSTSPNANFSKLNSSPLSQTSYTDTERTNGTTYYYQIKSVDKSGKEYNFSQVRNSQPMANPPSLILANATVSASTGSDGITTFNFSVLTKKTEDNLTSNSPTSVKLYIDLYNTNKHTFRDAGEILAMDSQDGGIYNYSTSLKIPDQYKPNANYNYLTGYAFYIEASDGTNTIRLPASGTYVTNMNNRLKNPGYKVFLTDPGSTQWRNHVLNFVKNKMATEGYNGLFIDSTVTGAYYTTGGLSDAMPENFNTTTFRNDVKGFISFMKQGLGSAAVTYNGLGDADNEYKDLTTDYLEVSDAGMHEEFIATAWNQTGYYDETGWKVTMDNIIKVNNLNRGAILQSHGDALNTQSRMLAFTSYLIAKGKHTYFYFADKGSYVKPNYYPEWRVSLGSPLESYSTVSGYQKQQGENTYYQKLFENGTVFVNPGDKTVSITLDKTYDKVEVSGGLIPELKDNDGKQGNGKLNLTPVSSLSLGAHSGAIVLKQATQQQPATITPPTITKVSPAIISLLNLNKGATAKIIITGKDFASGATVKVNDIKANTVTFKKTTSLEAVIPLTSLKPGQATVTVINKDGGSFVLAYALNLTNVPSPVITVSSPVNKAKIAANTVEIAGKINDPEAIVTIKVGSVDQGFVAVDGSTGAFKKKVNLKVGKNTITMTAKNVMGTGTKTLTVSNTYSAPVITVNSPADKTKIAANTVEIVGKVNDPTATVVIKVGAADQGSVEINSSTGAFKKKVELAFGKNTIVITSINVIGTTTKTLTISNTLIIKTITPTNLDSDNDQLTDVEEALFTTDPKNPDTDGDSHLDGVEVKNRYSPKAGSNTKLKGTNLVKTYTNPTYNYSVLYPSSWSAQATTNSKKEIVFTAKTKEFVKILVEDNPRNLSARAWFLTEFPGTDTSKITETTIGSLKGINNSLNDSIYLADGTRIYVLSYNFGARTETNFRTTFAMISSSFTLNESNKPKPAITKITPKTISLVNLKKGATAKITITGKNFLSGAAVKVNDIKATTVTVKSATSIQATIPLTSLKPSLATVTVTNTDKGTVTLAKAITLKGRKPTFASADPKTLPARKTGVGFLTLKGNNFLTDTKVLLDGKIAVAKTEILSSTRIKITINLSLIEKGKNYNLMIVNPDGQKATLGKAFKGK